MAPRSNSKLVKAEPAVSPLGVVAPPPIHVHSPAFEGSLATLFVCVREHRVDLLGVPLAPICEAYFAYLMQMPEANLDEAAAALVALAYLLERKAWMLLPTPEPEPEELSSLDPIIASIRGYDLAIEALAVWQAERERQFFRSPECAPDAYELPYELEGVTSDDLARALSRLLSRAAPTPPTPPERDERSLSQVVSAVLLAVSDRWKPLNQLLPDGYTRVDAVYWFLAVLELIRLGQISMRVAGDDVEFSRSTGTGRNLIGA